MKWTGVLGFFLFTIVSASAQDTMMLNAKPAVSTGTVDQVTVPESYLRNEKFRPQGGMMELSLRDAIDVAMQQNPQLRIAHHSLEGSFYDLDNTNSAYRNTIDMVASSEANLTQRGGGTFRLDENLGLIQVNNRVSENDELISVGPRYRRTFRNAVSVDINPSFDFQHNSERGFDSSPGNPDGRDSDGFPRISSSINVPLNSRPRLEIDTAIENAELNVIRSDYDLFIREQQIQEQVINTYWNIQQVKESLDITRERLLQSKQIEFILQVQYENEKEALVNVNQAAVDVLTNEANFIQQEGSFRSTIEQFNILLGTPIETNLQLTDELIVEPLPMSSDEYIAMITSTNLEIKDLKIAIQQLENNLRVTRLGQQPDLTFSTSFSRDDEGRQDISFGLFFTWAVFDGGSTKARTRALEESLAQQQINLSELERSLIQESYDDLRELQLQDQRIEILMRNVDQSRITLENALIMFREFGRITFRNMQDFQIDLANSRNSLLQAKVLYNRARSGLLQKVHEYEPSDRIAPLLEILR